MVPNTREILPKGEYTATIKRIEYTEKSSGVEVSAYLIIDENILCSIPLALPYWRTRKEKITSN